MPRVLNNTLVVDDALVGRLLGYALPRFLITCCLLTGIVQRRAVHGTEAFAGLARLVRRALRPIVARGTVRNKLALPLHPVQVAGLARLVACGLAADPLGTEAARTLCRSLAGRAEGLECNALPAPLYPAAIVLGFLTIPVLLAGWVN